MSVLSSAHPVASVLGLVVLENHVLLVRRMNPLDAGKWDYPAGWIDPGETWRRPLSGTEARCIFNALDAFDNDDEGALRRQFLMVAVLCARVSGTPIAGDDATEAPWFPIASLSRLENVSEDVDT